ncbi:MAG: DUF1015 domain-containing protein, partial [Anaerotardibacter sp.]
MAHVMPFPCMRVNPSYVSEVTSLPFDFFSDTEAIEYLLSHPKSFLHLDAAGIEFPEEVAKTGKVGFSYAEALINEYKEKGIYLQDDEPAFYVYRITSPNGDSHTGLLSSVSIEDYKSGAIKKHESTRKTKEEGCKRLMKTLGAQTSPLFLTYPSLGKLSVILDRIKEANEPLYSFVDDLNFTNEVWRVTEGDESDEIIELFSNVESLYIADGHHRAASAASLADTDTEGASGTGTIMALIFPSNETLIYDYNRAVAGLNNLTEIEFFDKIQENFTLEGPFSGVIKPEKKGTFGMYINENWYKLTFNKSFEDMNPVEKLDVSLLQDYILDPILGITDPKVDNRLDFVRGTRGVRALESRIVNGQPASVCFSLYPTQV